MSEQKKPRDIKDLKARLGRTITPGTKIEGDGIMPPPIGAPGIAPPPGSGPASVPPPPMLGPQVAPPPFMPPTPVVGPPMQAPQPAAPRDPFASAGPAVASQQVHLVFDERAVADSEVGRRGRFWVVLVSSLLTLAVGLVVGYSGGGIMGERKLYNRGVRDGKAVFQTVNTATDTVLHAKTLIDRIASAAHPIGHAAHVDYEAIGQLVALRRPLTADAFSRKSYTMFDPAAVDDLFTYYNNVNIIWDRLQVLQARTGQNRRADLDRAAASADEAATTQYGCAPANVNNNPMCELVYVLPPEAPASPPPAGQAPAPPDTFKVTDRPGGTQVDRTRFNGQEDFGTNPTHYVLLIDGQHSTSILGQRAGPFLEYLALVNELNELIGKTVEVQGRVTTALGNVARLDEQFAL